MGRAYSNRPDSKSGNLNPASLHVWNVRDRDWAKRKYGSLLAFQVMANAMLRDHRIRTRAIRKFVETFRGRAA
jgi:hypothetical protein